VLPVRLPVDWEPLSALLPLQPPDAVQLAAFDADQLNVALVPLATVLGLTLIATVGTAAAPDTIADWLAVPPGPLQTRA